MSLEDLEANKFPEPPASISGPYAVLARVLSEEIVYSELIKNRKTSLVTQEKIVLKNLPKVRDIKTMLTLLKSLGSKVKVKNNQGKEVDIGSICSGGAYGKLISRFKGVDVPGTGISFGVDRLVFALIQLEQIELDYQKPVLVCVMNEKYLKNYYEIVDTLRSNNINAEIFLDTKKNLGKQLMLANKRQLKVAVICGENEFNDNTVTIKNLKGIKGENNKTFPKEKLINEIRKII